jgi:hypothetical protein
MKYWKQGFYETPVEGAVKISDRRWRELLEGQAAGMEIAENENGVPILREATREVPVPSYEQLVQQKMRERYSVDDELAILRQRKIKTEQFTAYYEYAEQCKAIARQIVAERQQTDNDVQ